MSKKPVVVLRSNDICFQGILRSLGSTDVPCISVTFTWLDAKPWYSESSKYFNRSYEIVNPAENNEKASKQLIEIGKELFDEYKEKLFLIPSSDTNMALMQSCAEELSNYFLFIGAKDFSKFRDDVFDKSKTFSTFSGTDVAVPISKTCKSVEDIVSIAEEMIFPCIYKPAQKDYVQSFYRRHNGLKAVSVESREELIQQLNEEMKFGETLLVQEKILFDGPKQEIPLYIYADGEGKICMAVTAVKERIDPYPFGTATVLRLTRPAKGMLSIAEKIVEKLQWRGLLMIELIKDQKDSTWKLIELNGRPWLLIDFFRRSGFNFLSMLYDDHYQSLMSSELRQPQWKTPEQEPIHYDLATIVREEKLQGQENMKELFAEYPGRPSFIYLLPGDEEPAVREAKDMGWGDLSFLKEISCEY